MKRSLKDVDDLIPESVWQLFPDNKKKLLKIQEIENNFEQIETNIRKQIIDFSSPIIKRKILRIFIHHKYIPQSETDKAHFIINVEGQLLCPTSIHYSKVGQYFDKIRFQIDKKNVMEKQYEWNANTNPISIKSNVFRVKIYTEKFNQTVKIFFHRSTDPRPRYEISQKLRVMFPYMSYEAPEEEIMIAVWSYLVRNKLFLEGRERERKLIKCDELLKDLLVTNSDTYVFNSLHGKILSNLSPCKPIQVDYMLNNMSTQFVPGCYGPKEFSKQGGRAYDVEVDVPDYTRYESVHHLSQLVEHIHEAEKNISEMEPRLVYLARLLSRQSSSTIDSKSITSSTADDHKNTTTINDSQLALLAAALSQSPQQSLYLNHLSSGAAKYLTSVAQLTDIARLIANRPVEPEVISSPVKQQHSNASTTLSVAEVTSVNVTPFSSNINVAVDSGTNQDRVDGDKSHQKVEGEEEEAVEYQDIAETRNTKKIMMMAAVAESANSADNMVFEETLTNVPAAESSSSLLVESVSKSNTKTDIKIILRELKKNQVIDTTSNISTIHNLQDFIDVATITASSLEK